MPPSGHSQGSQCSCVLAPNNAIIWQQAPLTILGSRKKTGMGLSGDGNFARDTWGQLGWIQSNLVMVFNILLASCPCVSGLHLL